MKSLIGSLVYDVEAEASGMKKAKRKNILVYSPGTMLRGLHA